MKNAWAVGVSTWMILGAATVVRADNTTCGAAITAVPDGSMHTGDLSSTAPNRWFRFVGKAGRSYALMLENLSPSDQQASIGIVGVFQACGGPLHVTNEVVDPQEPASIDPTFTVGAGRQSIKFSNDGEAFFVVGPVNANGGAQFRIRVEETTLFSPFWSTAGGFTTHYRLYNTTNIGCSVTLDLRKEANTVPAGGTPAVTFILAGNQSTYRNTGSSDLNIGGGQQGHASLAHDCTPGAVMVEAWMTHGGSILPVDFRAARQSR